MLEQKRWYRHLKDTGNVLKRKGYGRPRVSRETVNVVRQCFERWTKQSVRSVGRDLNQPKSTVWKVLRIWLYWIEAIQSAIAQEIESENCKHRKEFSNKLNDLLEGNNFSNNVVFGDESTFHLLKIE